MRLARYFTTLTVTFGQTCADVQRGETGRQRTRRTGSQGYGPAVRRMAVGAGPVTRVSGVAARRDANKAEFGKCENTPFTVIVRGNSRQKLLQTKRIKQNDPAHKTATSRPLFNCFRRDFPSWVIVRTTEQHHARNRVTHVRGLGSSLCHHLTLLTGLSGLRGTLLCSACLGDLQNRMHSGCSHSNSPDLTMRETTPPLALHCAQTPPP